ncbi:MAG: PIN domain nuclease [Chloroflexi bacterium]|nr:MAG: PIN domain nuclease [Chloroflexota bacterium]PIE80784.1 MAG: PIN domain nuclease [Chloroflexota bacterium]
MGLVSFEFILRLIGAMVGSVVGGFWGARLASFLDVTSEAYVVVLGLTGFLAGLILTPYFTTRPLQYITKKLSSMPPERLTAVVIGIFIGLVATALLTFPLSLLPTPFGQLAPLVAAYIFCYLSIFILVSRQNELKRIIKNSPISSTDGSPLDAPASDALENFILLDTSVIIDGRILDISKTGFIRSTLLVPNFILLELQHIADSADPMRRNRGRRGMEILSELQNDSPVLTKITDVDVSEAREADTKLMALGRHLKCPIMTNDYNLNRVAELQGVTVLNINDLANAVKAIFLPGETLTVKIIQQGRETDQGVGYLEDGTMVVVENGNHLVDATARVIVTKVLQTAAGRMIFARL